MKLGLIPESLVERVALRSGKVPVPLIDVLFGPIKARVVMAGVRLGIMDTLAREPATAKQLAAALGLDADCLEMLLRVLVHSDYLDLQGPIYSLSKLARRTLAPGAAMDRRSYVEWNYTQWEILGHMEQLIRSGAGIDLHESLRGDEAWGQYQRAMLENARDHAGYLAAKVPVPAHATSLIDLGGSHGLLGAAICRKHPPLRSVVFELEPALESARALAQSEGIAGVVEHKPADILRDPLGDGHDVALLANVLHHFTPAQIAGLLTKVHAALHRKGAVAIWEVESTKPGAKAGWSDAVALYFRLTSSASAYRGEEYAGWLQGAGFEQIRVVRPRLCPGYVLITARLFS